MSAETSTSSDDGSNDFALSLYRAMSGQATNLFFCPFGIRLVLALACAGARGETERQMVDALRFRRSFGNVSQELVDSLRDVYAFDKPECRLAIAMSLWFQKGLALRSEYLDAVGRYGEGSVNALDFRADPERARMTINEWIEEKTSSQIKNLIPPGAMNPGVRFALANAVYFAGSWLDAFRPEWTFEAPFFLAGGKTTTVQLMWRVGRLSYLHTNGCQMVDLPYRGDDLSMLVVLPVAKDGLEELERQLTAQTLQDWVQNMRYERVNLSLPRFKLSWRNELTPALKALGMSLAFAPERADFSGINGVRPPDDESLFFSAVFHEAVVDVAEEGTTAAAATAAIFETLGVQRETTLRADHPFLFAIRNRRNGAILFLGRLADPTSGATQRAHDVS